MAPYVTPRPSYVPPAPTQVCAGCGSSCPTQPPTREPIQFPFGCTDYAADADGKMWRDSSGYTCKAYQYGNFCALNAQTGRYMRAPRRCPAADASSADRRR